MKAKIYAHLGSKYFANLFINHFVMEIKDIKHKMDIIGNTRVFYCLCTTIKGQVTKEKLSISPT